MHSRPSRTFCQSSATVRARGQRPEVQAAGQPVRSIDDLFGVLRSAAPGGTMEMTVLRGTEERSVQVTFGQPEADA